MFKWLKKEKAPQEKKEGKLYNLRTCYWGHSVVFDGDGKLLNSRRVHGWLTPHISKGDMFLFPATKGLAVWLLTEVKNCNDPSDMFFGEAGIIRYATEEDLKRVSEAKPDFQFV